MAADDPIDNLLKRAVPIAGISGDEAVNPCPEEDALADYLEGLLNSSDEESVETHLSKCPRCRHTIVTAQATAEALLKSDRGKITRRETDQTSRELPGFGRGDFEVELSRFEAELGLEEKEVSTSEGLHCVMVVDDDSGYLAALVDSLSNEYSVIACSNGYEAVERMNNQVETIVLDIKMPGMSGLDTAREIKKDFQDVPLIFNTGYAGEYPKVDIQQEYDPFCYVTKDNSDHLFTCVNRAVNQSQITCI